MVTQQQFKDHYNSLYNNGAIYLWGANCEVITKELTDKLYKSYGSSTYTKAYYDDKYNSGKGKIGADCSGSIYPLSKADNTAKGYYNACNKRGSINNLPTGTACLVFNSGFTHVAAYMGDGTTIEMANSTKNCVKEKYNKSRWTYYGIPNWLETGTVAAQTTASTDTVNAKPTSTNTKSEIIKNIQKWCNSYCNAGLSVDGAFGPKTKAGLCKALQHYLNIEYKANLSVDGSFGPKTKAACKVAKSGTPLAYICQAMLYCKGYDMSHSISNNNLDGSIGRGTAATILKYQQDTKGLRQDGECGPATFYALFNS